MSDCKGAGFPALPWLGIIGNTPVVPKLYWDVYSSEQRWKEICCELQHVIDYARQLGEGANIDHAALEEIQAVLNDIQAGKYVDGYIDQLAAYIDANLQALVARMVRYVFPQFYWDGAAYRLALTVPQSWDWLKFKFNYQADGSYTLSLQY